MKHVNGDIDDLFRRAAEKYPLRTDSADWFRMAAALEKEPDSPSDPEGSDRRRRRFVFWWFLLLPLAGIGYFAIQKTGHHANRPAAPSFAANPASTGGTPAAASTPAVSTPEASTPSASAPEASTPTASTTANAGTATNTGTTSNTATATAAGTPGIAPRSEKNKRRYAAGAEVAATSAGRTSAGRAAAGRAPVPGIPGTNAAGKPGDPLPFALDLALAQTREDYNLDIHVKSIAVDATQDNTQKPAKKTTASSKSSHGYIGLLAAPDFSTVRFQSMKGVGATFGLLLGYAFNDRWAVESGVYVDRKRYYTSGEYFNTKDVTLPYGSTNLLNVDGTCYMWEIPLNLRYNFNKNARMQWFATAGLSTYLMTREKYNYTVQETGGGMTWPASGAWNVDSASHYIFSVINLSAGFEQRLGKIGNLRIEPYLRIPLSGIGTGHLPIMSGGVNIGITRRLW